MGFWDVINDKIREAAVANYELYAVSTKEELLGSVGEFTEPIRMALVREIASGIYPNYANVIAYSREEYNFHLKHDDGYMYRWHGDLGCALPTKERLDADANHTLDAPTFPDPEQASSEIASEATNQTSELATKLRDAFEDALADIDLPKLADTAAGHAQLYEALKALKEEHISTTIADISGLSDTWKGDDADRYAEQYGENVGMAVDTHVQMAHNLHEAADIDFAIQVALHYSLAGLLEVGASKISELSKESLLEHSFKVIAGSGVIISFLGLARTGPAVAAIGITGAVAGYLGVEYLINPDIDTIPDRSSVTEVVDDLIAGAGNAFESARKSRMDYRETLKDNLNRDDNDLGSPKLVPGTGYYG